jgi:hypothetical protein
MAPVHRSTEANFDESIWGQGEESKEETRTHKTFAALFVLLFSHLLLSTFSE